MPSGLLTPSPDSYSVIPISDFSGGLNLAAGSEDPDVVGSGQCIDCLNVTFTQLGALRQRSGTQFFNSGSLPAAPDSMTAMYTSSGIKRLLVGCGNQISALNSSAGSVVSPQATTAHPHYFARYAAPNEEAVFIANGTDVVRKFVPATDTFSTPGFTAPAFGAVKPKFVFSFENRLVGANWPGFPSRVAFTNPGDPLVWPDNNFEDLEPGDGEQIMGGIVWGERLYVFKETGFYVFPRSGTDSDGNADFSNFYPVRTGVGLVAPNGLAAAPDALYFLDRKGVYKTRGQAPTQVSQNLDPMFLGNVPLYFQSNGINAGSIGGADMKWFNNRIYLSVPTGGAANDRVLVYDPRYGWWSLFDWPASCMAVFRPSTNEELMFGFSNGLKSIARYSDSSGLASDYISTFGGGGTAITARWRSGWFSYYYRYRGRWFPDDSIHRLREAKVAGEGTVTFEVSKDYQNVFRPAVTKTFGATTGSGSGPEVWSTDPTDVWSTDPADVWSSSSTTIQGGTTKHKLVRGIGLRGSVFSVRLSNNTVGQSFAVHTFENHVTDTRDPTFTEVAA